MRKLYSLSAHTRRIVSHFPLKMLCPRTPPNREPQIPRNKFELDQKFNFNLYREIPRNLSVLDLVDVVDFGDVAFSVDTEV